MLDFVFDPINFICGIAVASAAFGAKNTLFSRLSGKSRTVAWDGFVKKLNKARQDYASLAAQLEKIEADKDNVRDTFTHAFPKHSFENCFDSHLLVKAHKGITSLLLLLNEADDFDSQTKASEMKSLMDNIEGSIKELNHLIKCAQNGVKNFENRVKWNVEYHTSFTNNEIKYQNRFDAITKTFADMRECFVPVFLEKIPPTIFAAEKALQENKDYWKKTKNQFITPGYDTTYDSSNLEKALNNADKALLKVSDFTSTVMKRTAKRRIILRRISIQNLSQQRAYDAALESLIQAELAVYDSGNPDETFAKITQPFFDFALKHQLLRYDDRMAVNK